MKQKIFILSTYPAPYRVELFERFKSVFDTDIFFESSSGDLREDKWFLDGNYYLLDTKRGLQQFKSSVKEIKKYCGLNFKKTIFMTFGNHDIRILNQSCAYNLNSPKELCDVIKKSYVDFQVIISEFIKDDNGNPLSLSHYLELFNVQFDGTAHDPLYDAVNLARLYNIFQEGKDIVLAEYLKVLRRANFGPQPVNKAVHKLVNGESVTPREFLDYIRDYIK